MMRTTSVTFKVDTRLARALIAIAAIILPPLVKWRVISADRAFSLARGIVMRTVRFRLVKNG